MADINFIVKNGLTVNTNFVVNSSSLSYSGNSTLNGTNTVINSNTTFNGNNSFFNSNIIVTAGKGINANGSLGSQGQALLSNGSSIYWATATAGSNTQIQFNDSQTANASAAFTFNKTTNTVTVSNTVSTVNITTNTVSTNTLSTSGLSTINNLSVGVGGTNLRRSNFANGEAVFVPYTAAEAAGNNYFFNLCNSTGNNGTSMNLIIRGLANNAADSVALNTVQMSTTTLGVSGDIVSAYSDERLKDIIGPIPNALEKVKALTGFYYTPNKTALIIGVENNQLSKVGVSAQQVREVLPEVVKDAPIGSGYLTVQYEKIIPLLIEAIKELEAKVGCTNCSCGGK